MNIPNKTVKGYKLFRQIKGNLYPLYVKANQLVPLGTWLKAEIGEITASGKVKSKLGELAMRPGWHGSDYPVATHIGGKLNKSKKPVYRPDNQVWCEVEFGDDVNWQDEVQKRAKRNKKGKIIAKTACLIDRVPDGGYYRFKTNPNMFGNWMIAGEMKVNKILTDDEVLAINKKTGFFDLPRLNHLT